MFLKVQSEKNKLGLSSPMRTLSEYKRREHNFQSAHTIATITQGEMIILYEALEY